jgi:tripartite-type tricarboxylate transporter receptor subunit TctC
MLAFSVLLFAAQSLAQTAVRPTYPTKSVRIVVPFAPGGSADGIARPIAEKLGALLGQPFIVDNRPGAGATIGAALVAKSDPDGYTLLVMPGTHVLATRLLKSVPFHPVNDFTPIANLAFVPNVLISGKQLPFTTLKDMVAYAKANPGKLSVGVSDVSGRLAGEAIGQAGGITLTSVNYKGGSPIAGDVAGGHLPLGFGSQISVLPFYMDQRVLALGVTSPKRISTMPEVPTVAEALGVADFDLQTWFALAGPKGMPKPIVDRLQQAVAQILADPETHAKLQGLGVVPAEDATSAGLAMLMKTYAERNGALLNAAGIEPE